MGVFVKGTLGKVNYRVSVNDTNVKSLDNATLASNTIKYQGSTILGARDTGKTD